MKFYPIPGSMVNQNMHMKDVLRCWYKDEVFYFNIGVEEPEITADMKENGEWMVYTWAD